MSPEVSVDVGALPVPSIVRAKRLGIYLDAPFRVVDLPSGRVVGAHPADFSLAGVFLPEVGAHFASLSLFGRSEQVDELGEYVPLPDGVEFVELPYYGALHELGSVLRAGPRTVRIFWRILGDVDVVWVFGPHPFALLLLAFAWVRRKDVVLGIRQDTMAYFRSRLPGPRWTPLLVPLYVLDRAFRLAARRVKTLVAGREIARQYGATRAGLALMADSVVRSDDIAPAPPARDWSGPIELLTVGRIDPEKNPTLLVDVIAALEARSPGRFSLTWVGGGALEERVRTYAAERDVLGRIDLRGWLPFGPEVLDLYRRAHVFVHVSKTEGAPRVLYEALACGVPIAATDVGGIRAVLDGGRAGLLFPPDDRDAVVDAIEQIVSDSTLRRGLVAHGLELGREQTLEAQAARVAAFISGSRKVAA